MSWTDPSKIMLCGSTKFPTCKVENYTLRLETEEPSAEIKEIARKELRENPDLVEQSIKELQALLREEDGLYCPLENEAWLVRFLRPTKFYPKSALQLIKNYYSFRVKHKDVYDNLVPSKEKNVFSHDVINVLPNRDQLGRRILILSLGKKWKHNEVTLDEFYKGAVLFTEAATLEPATQICGASVIFDMDGLSLAQTMKFTPPFAKRIVDWLQDTVNVRIKGIHITNQPYIFNMVFALFKPFLREKLKNRIIFHGTDRKSLHKYLDPSCLPKEYGGTLELTLPHAMNWFSILEELEPEYEKINSYGYKKQIKE